MYHAQIYQNNAELKNKKERLKLPDHYSVYFLSMEFTISSLFRF